jgi:hypothetical protein
MVSATHNHAGPAVTDCGDVARDGAYVESFVARLTEAFGRALGQRREAEVGVRTSFEFRIAHNRRVLMRDGTARTHGRFSDPGALCLEGPIDPEVTVVAVRAKGGSVLGALVNYSCHPTHFGGDTTLSAGFPGVLARRMKEHGCPVTLYLNGACGNLHTSDPAADGADMSMDEAGGILAEHARQALAGTNWRGDVRLSATAKTVALPFREVSEAQIRGTVRGAQRFIDPAIYDRGMERLVRKIRERGTQDAEVQALSLDEYVLVAIPAEFFVQLGLKIKLRAHPRHALVVSCANGMVGYVPHAEAFAHGGYETTFGEVSFLAPQAGDLFVDAAAELIPR